MQSQNAIFVGVSTVLVPYSLLLYSGMSLRSVYTEISFFCSWCGTEKSLSVFLFLLWTHPWSGLLGGVFYQLSTRLSPGSWFPPPPSIWGENFLDPLYLGVINFYFQNLGGKSPLGGTGNYLGGTTPSKVYISDTTKF